MKNKKLQVKIKELFMKKVKRKKNGSNMKGRTFRKLRRARKMEIPQPLSTNPLNLYIGEAQFVKQRPKKRTIYYEVLPSYFTNAYGRNI